MHIWKFPARVNLSYFALTLNVKKYPLYKSMILMLRPQLLFYVQIYEKEIALILQGNHHFYSTLWLIKKHSIKFTIQIL